MTTFTTSLDKSNKITTIIVSVILLVILIPVFLLMPEDGQNIAKSFAFIPTIGIVVAFLFRPNNYSVSPNKLLIHRMIKDVEIDRNNILSVQEIDDLQIKNSIRTFGVGGFFGSFGKFSNGKLGDMIWYTTRRNNIVLVETKDQKKIILTPDKPEEFVASFNQQQNK